MSALFGVVGTVSPLELDEMGRRLAHRGNVASWQEVSRNVFLGRVASQSTPPEAGARLISVVDASSQEDCAKVRAALRSKNPISALEVEPNLPFAFAAYSEADDCLILGRDYFGLKPLHFCRLPSGGIAFATEYKALLALNEIEAVADLEAIEHLQRYKAVPPGRTMLKGIEPVPPGSAVYFERTGAVRHVQRMPEVRMSVRSMDEDTASKLVREKLLEATARLVSGNSRIALALSGGIDSLSVAAMARAVAPEADLIAFTAGECPEDPEIHRAAHAMSHLKGQHETLYVSTEELMARLPLAVWHLENPIGRSETFQYLAIAKRARECGVDTMLTGMGADLLFGGMPRHKVLWMAEVMPQIRKSLLAFFTSTQTGEPPAPLLARCMMKMYYRGGLATPPRVQGSGHVEEPELIAEAGPEFLNRCLMLDGQEPTSRTLARIERPLQAYGIEYTSPYLDTSIVDFAFTIPGALKIKNGTQKYILRKAMQPLVGEKLYKAPKALMRMKQNSDFANALDSLAARYLSSDRVRRRGFFNEQDVSRIRAAARTNNHPENVMRLWTMLVTEIWAEIYLDGRGRHPSAASSVATPATDWSAVAAPALG